jgi:uncharacterized protein (DUF433 family)
MPALDSSPLDWSQCPAVESIPGKVSGAWVFRDTRLPVATVIENLEDLSIEEVMEQFDVTREQITAVLEFVAQSLKAPGPGANHGAPGGVSRVLQGHVIVTAKAKGWDRLANGALLKVAGETGVDLLSTTDQRIYYQQNLMGRKIAIAVLAGAATPGSFAEVYIPYK